jgi:hypothetical protein
MSGLQFVVFSCAVCYEQIWSIITSWPANLVPMRHDTDYGVESIGPYTSYYRASLGCRWVWLPTGKQTSSQKWQKKKMIKTVGWLLQLMLQQIAVHWNSQGAQQDCL